MTLRTALGSIGIPAGWDFSLVTLAAMLGLAGLDFAGAIFAKEWTDRRQPLLFILGLITFGILFVVYARILETAELSIVTIGWVVFLQVGLLLVDRFRYGVDLPPAKWATIALILVLEAYLVLGPSGNGEGSAIEPAGVMGMEAVRIEP